MTEGVSENDTILMATQRGSLKRISFNKVIPRCALLATCKILKLIRFNEPRCVAINIVSFSETPSVITKRISFKILQVAKRAQRGITLLKELKKNPHRIVAAHVVTSRVVWPSI
jgi:topoisomerase-4 subunit A